MARREHGMIYVNRGAEEADDNIYEPCDVSIWPAGQSPPPLPAPRPAVSLVPQGAEKPQEKKAKQSKCLAITFGVTTVLFAGMFAVVFGMFIMKDQSMEDYMKVLNASLEENNLKIEKLQTELENEKKTIVENNKKIQELQTTLAVRNNEFTRKFENLESNQNTLNIMTSNLQSRAAEVELLYDIKIRLVNGATSYRGRVEIRIQGHWGTICDDKWGREEATVVCKQLGKSGVIKYDDDNDSIKHPGPYGEGTGPILMDDVDCTGTESRITDCFFTFKHSCSHVEDVWVECTSY